MAPLSPMSLRETLRTQDGALLTLCVGGQGRGGPSVVSDSL